MNDAAAEFVCPHGFPVRPGAGYALDQCRPCWVDAGGDPDAPVVGVDVVAPPAAKGPDRFRRNCAHRGDQTRTLGQGCSSCRVYGCTVHGECMLANHLDRGALPLCLDCPDYRPPGPAPAAPPAASSVVIDHGAGGLGDGLQGLCAVAGLKAERPDLHVTYRPGAAAHPFVTLFFGYDALGERQSKTPEADLPDAIQLNAGYSKEFPSRFAVARWERYAKNAGAGRCVIPGLRDTAATWEAGRDLAGRVVLFPFSTEPAREWSVQHYLTLCRLLAEAGHKVAVAHTDDRKLAPFRCERWVGLPPERLTGALMGAVAVVGPDSGPAHLGGILGVPTIVLGGYTPVERIFGFYPRAVCLQGPLDCTGCCSQAPIDRRCRASCAAIQMISPDRVAAEVARVAR